MRFIIFASFSGVAALAPLTAQAADRFLPGQYEFISTSNFETQAYTQCVTPEDVVSVNSDAAAGREHAEKASRGACTVKAWNVRGDMVSFTIACGETVSSSSAIYHGDSFEGDMTTTVGGVTRSVHTMAKRVGPCK